MQPPTLRELFAYNDWARDRVLHVAAGLAAGPLDRPFDMGPGTLRATLHHLWGAERVWLDRWQAIPRERHAAQLDNKAVELPVLQEWFQRTAAERDAFLAAHASAAELDRPITYTNFRGETFTQPLGLLALHVCNHGVHHRAQAANMLRRVGAQPPRLDYVFMRLERPTCEQTAEQRAWLRERGLGGVHDPVAPPPYSIADLRTYFRYTDWAQQQVLGAAEALGDEALDRPFEMGLGSLRKTLLHLIDAEQWWEANWRSADHGIMPQPWQALPAQTPMAAVGRLWREAAAARNARLERASDAELQRPVNAATTPGRTLAVRMGESLLQLCGHGTHHRAQALNMLRHLGGRTPGLDLVTWLREAGGRAEPGCLQPGTGRGRDQVLE